MSQYTGLPKTGFVRLNQIIGDPRRGIQPIIPVSRASWYLGIKAGRYPAPIKLSPRVAVYRVEDIRTLVEKGGTTNE